MAETGISDFYRGDTKRYTLRFTKNGIAVNITDAKLFFTMKEKPSDSDANAALQKLVTVHTDPINGISEVLLTSAETAQLTPKKKYYYDFQIVDKDGNVSTLLSGIVMILEDITTRTS